MYTNRHSQSSILTEERGGGWWKIDRHARPTSIMSTDMDTSIYYDVVYVFDISGHARQSGALNSYRMRYLNVDSHRTITFMIPGYFDGSLQVLLHLLKFHLPFMYSFLL